MKPSRIDKVTSDEASRLLPGRRWRRRDRRGARPPSCALQAGTVGPRPRSRNSLVTRKLVPALFIALAAAVAVPGCGGGGGGVKPEPPPCIPTHSGICRSPAEFRAAAAPLAENYRRDENVANQLGLRDVGAHCTFRSRNLCASSAVEPRSPCRWAGRRRARSFEARFRRTLRRVDGGSTSQRSGAGRWPPASFASAPS